VLFVMEMGSVMEAVGEVAVGIATAAAGGRGGACSRVVVVGEKPVADGTE
jgi:hypothetical protein